MKVITDCSADIHPDEAAALGIEVLPLYIHFPNETIDATTLAPDVFYDRLAALYPQIPTTSLPSPDEFAQHYTQAIEQGQQVLSIHISSGLSGTYNSACVAVKTMETHQVHLVDSLTLSGGLRFQVLAAVKALKAGWPLPDIRERLKAIQAKAEVIYTLETLEYLAAGGRIGRVQALAGSVLNLKPIINVDKSDGQYNTISKTRTLKRAMRGIVSHLEDTYGAAQALTVTVLHGQVAQQANALHQAITDALNVTTSEITRISPVLGVHTGPGIVGAAVVPTDLLTI